MADQEEKEESCTRCGGEPHPWALAIRKPDIDEFMTKCLDAVNAVIKPMNVPGMDKELDGLGGRLFDAASNAVGAVMSAPIGERHVSIGVGVGDGGPTVFGVRAFSEVIEAGPDGEKGAVVRLAFDMALIVHDVQAKMVKNEGHAHDRDTAGPGATPTVGTA